VRLAARDANAAAAGRKNTAHAPDNPEMVPFGRCFPARRAGTRAPQIRPAWWPGKPGHHRARARPAAQSHPFSYVYGFVTQ